jgi:CemA family
MSKKSKKSSRIVRIARQVRPVEPLGIIPASIFRTLGRFVEQLFQTTNTQVITEFRISRYQLLVSLRIFLCLVFLPFIVNGLTKNLIVRPVTAYIWNGQQEDIFLNSYLEKEALDELQGFEEQLYFDFFASPKKYETPIWASYQDDSDPNAIRFPVLVKAQLQLKTIDLAKRYNKQSIEALTNFCGDIISFCTLATVIVTSKPGIIIFKSFTIEFFYSLSDTLKSGILIFGSNLLVGFHSPKGWEFLLQCIFDRFGFPPNESFILVFVATFPVLLDTVFKYWIFRYLNRISPSTVATYHAMLE